MFTTEGVRVAGSSGMLTMQHGGEAKPGDVALVGEKGPELVQFPHGGHLFPAPETRRMLSAAQSPELRLLAPRGPITFNIYGATDPSEVARVVDARLSRLLSGS